MIRQNLKKTGSFFGIKHVQTKAFYCPHATSNQPIKTLPLLCRFMGVVNWVLHIPKSIYKNTEEMFFQDVNPESIEIMRNR